MATLDPAVTALCSDLNAEAVKEIIDTDLTDSQINNFLNVAYYMTIPLTGKLTACGGTSMHCEIIKYLAAHAITTGPSGGQVKSQSVGSGEWSVSFWGKDGEGLRGSSYGQDAIAMDCSGILAGLGLKRASLQVADYAQLEDLPD